MNLFAVLASVLCNLLFFAGGQYANITWESATHAAGARLAYSLLLHRLSAKAAARAAVIVEAQHEEEREAALRDKHRCLHCRKGFLSDATVRGHLGSCPQRP